MSWQAVKDYANRYAIALESVVATLERKALKGDAYAIEALSQRDGGAVRARAFKIAMPSGEPPREFQIFAYGKNKTLNGDYTFDQESAAAVMANAVSYGNAMTLDYEHQSLNSEENGQPAPAAGTFDLQLRADGLYAVNVIWTEKASEFLRAREYLYYSPAFIPDDKGRPKRLLPVALTNVPATKNMRPLV